ncbi:MAG: fatty acid desaturase [Colwellia sp.]|nr:fatty acid desaturase [Colwellia sp.]
MHKQSIQRIVSGINLEEVRLKDRYPFLHNQNLIGFTIMLFAVCGMLGSALLYSYGIIPAWLCIILAGFFASISHELEHDLIHKLYFRDNTFMHNLMMSIVWLMRPNTINPWYRRKIHLLHHKTSGTEQDLEERLVGNGITNILVRCIVMFDGLFGLLLQRKVLKKEVKAFNFLTIFNAGFPLATLYFILGYIFIIYHCISYFLPNAFIYPQWVLTNIEWINFFMVVIIAPNFIRSACLNLVTSYMHYYGNVTNLLQQTQVIKGWFMWPFNIFCFNFSGTHSIHHFVIKQPFYLRQMVAGSAHKLMKANGVRFNDFSTFNQGNRFKDI